MDGFRPFPDLIDANALILFVDAAANQHILRRIDLAPARHEELGDAVSKGLAQGLISRCGGIDFRCQLPDLLIQLVHNDQWWPG